MATLAPGWSEESRDRDAESCDNPNTSKVDKAKHTPQKGIQTQGNNTSPKTKPGSQAKSGHSMT